MSRIDGLIRSNTAPRVEKSSSGGGDRLTSPLAPSFGRVYDQEDDHNQPAKKSVLSRVREKARKWRQTLLKKRHGQDGANTTPAWGVTLEDDDDDEFQAYESTGNEYKDTHLKSPFSPPNADANNNNNSRGSKDTTKTTTRNNSLSSAAEKEKHEHITKDAATQIPDVSAEKKQHENRETQSQISSNPSSSPPPLPPPDDHDQQPVGENKEDKDHASVKNPTSSLPPAPASAAAHQAEGIFENPHTGTPGFLADKLERKGKTVTPLPVAFLNEKRGWEDAPVRNPSPMPGKGHDYRDKSMSRRTLHATPVATIKEEPQQIDTPSIHLSMLMKKPSTAAAAADQQEQYEDVKMVADPAPEKESVNRSSGSSSGSSKTLTEMVADTLQPVYNMVSGATQNVAMKFQGGGGGEGGNGEESGGVCNSRLEKSVSMKEYLMQKLEPGAEERALSRVISDVMAPKNAGAKVEAGVMGKMRDAVTSFLGMEQDSSSPPAPAPAPSPALAPSPPNDNRRAVETQKTVQFDSESLGMRMQKSEETEEREERRLQTN